MTPRDDQKLEQFIHQALRSVPPRPAPRSLETRVLAAIAARQALPWWRQSFARWPLPARAAFLALALALVAAIAWLSLAGSELALPAIREMLAPLAHLRVALEAVADIFALLFRSIPTLWLYSAAATVAALYAALFGLGATAYRTLFVNR
ncbi:MAG: hypothetical protein HZA31_10070 [Opitutae bacterium]|nr:hypothetical protein [Opitutae bacterium]